MLKGFEFGMANWKHKTPNTDRAFTAPEPGFQNLRTIGNAAGTEIARNPVSNAAMKSAMKSAAAKSRKRMLIELDAIDAAELNPAHTQRARLIAALRRQARGIELAESRASTDSSAETQARHAGQNRHSLKDELRESAASNDDFYPQTQEALFSLTELVNADPGLDGRNTGEPQLPAASALTDISDADISNTVTPHISAASPAASSVEQIRDQERNQGSGAHIAGENRTKPGRAGNMPGRIIHAAYYDGDFLPREPRAEPDDGASHHAPDAASVVAAAKTSAMRSAGAPHSRPRTLQEPANPYHHDAPETGKQPRTSLSENPPAADPPDPEGRAEDGD